MENQDQSSEQPAEATTAVLRDAVRGWAAENVGEPCFRDEPADARLSCKFPIQKEELTLDMFVDADDGAHTLTVFAYVDFEVPEERRNEVEALVTLASPRCLVGSLELLEVQKVRFRADFNLEDTTPSPNSISNMVGAAIMTCSELLPALVAVVTGGQSARDALDATSDDGTPGEGSTPDATWLDEVVEPLPWDSFRGVAPIKRWAEGLRTQPNDDDLAAHAVLFVGQDLDACQSVARLAATEAGYRFAFVPRDQVDVQSPAMLASYATLAPVVVFLQNGRWILSDDSTLDKEHQDKTKAFQSLLLRSIKSHDPKKPVLFATSVSSVRTLAPELTFVGAFDLAFAVPEPAPAARGESFLDAVGRDICGDTLLAHAGKLGKALALAFNGANSRALVRLQLRRLAAREGRKVEFIDLVEIYTRGFVEAAPVDDSAEPMREHVAVHEAGHAAMAVIDSGGFDVPDFCTILPSVESRGVVVSSLSHLHDAGAMMTYDTFRHSVRVSLAGRAAEELVYGPLQVGNGASSDLEAATRLAFRAFGGWGFSPAMDTPEASRSNLAVVVDAPAEAEIAHNVGLVRQFLAEEYTHVLVALRKHRALLDAIRDRLLVDPVIDRSELAEVCERQGLHVEAAE